MYDPTDPVPRAPADVLQHYRGHGVDSVYVSLQGYDIRDLVPYMSSLAQIIDMKSLNLAHNELHRLPEDMSALLSLEALDLRHNPFAAGSMGLLRGLDSLPMLQHLRIDLPEKDEDDLLAQLANLKTFNGVALHTGPGAVGAGSAAKNFADGEDGALLLQELQAIADEDPEPYIGYANIPPPKATVEFLPWTADTTDRYNHVYQQVARVSGTVSNPDEYSDFSHLVTTHVRAKTKADPDLMKRHIHNFNAGSLLLEYSFDELARSAGEKYGNDMAAALHAIFDEHVRQTQYASNLLNMMQEENGRRMAAVQQDLARELFAKERARVKAAGGAVASTNQLMSDQEIQQLEMEHKSKQVQEGVLNLHEMRSTIERLIDSKRHHDEANDTAKLPKETLEQHIYSHYFSRSNSDDEIKAKVATVYNSVKRWSPEDLDAEVFGLILRNELDEPYWAQHQHLSTVLYDAMHSTLVSTGEERAGDLRDLNGTLDPDVCKRILEVAFPSKDILPLMRRVSNAMRRTEGSQLQGVGGTGIILANDYEIGYKEFVQTVCRAHLAQHMNQINPIATEWKKLDLEHGGTIDAAQFRLLISAMYPGISTIKAQDLLAAVDPAAHGVVRFSDCVRILKKIERRPGASKRPSERLTAANSAALAAL